MTTHLPQGFRAAGVHCGIKSNPKKEDLALLVSDRPAVAAGVYTQNQVCAAAVTLNRSRTPSDVIRTVVINSGNANACTAEQGDRDAREMTQLAAAACGATEEQALVMSTGIIGEMLPMEKIRQGVKAATGCLGDDEASLVAAARGMMTTDTVHKLAAGSLDVDGRTLQVTGMTKGSAMIGPNMATMLAVVMTDAAIAPADAQASLSAAVDDSFNCISVEGHTSTNDTVLFLANGAAGGEPLSGKSLVAFQRVLGDVCEELARSIPADGEGATHLIRIEVHGCRGRDEAHCIAKAVANSPLVKTAITGADPNWGRIVSAAGYAGVCFDPTGISLLVNEQLLYENGAPTGFDAEAVSESIRSHHLTSIVLIFSEGDRSARFWTTDLTAEYVRLNAEYHT